jgi:phosphatidylglycerol:prolipoprotein diacylglycerol transferase
MIWQTIKTFPLCLVSQVKNNTFTVYYSLYFVSFLLPMIAFHLWWRPVYRYGLFYGITFLSGYLFLEWIGKKKLVAAFPRLQDLLTVHLDTVVLWVIGAIMLGGRLGHVFLYDRAYYQNHLGEILHVREGWMSFIWWVIGVIIVLIGIRKYYKLTVREFLLLGDLVLCIVPLGIFLWRIWNYLNKELYGLPIESSSPWFDLLVRRWLAVDYSVDATPTMRINTNILQSLGEWLLPLFLGQWLFRKQVARRYLRPGLISGCFFIVYACVRFSVEYLKELPVAEMYAWLSISQRLMFFFFIGWCVLVVNASKSDHT